MSEIDGGLTHLKWRETVIPLPRFTDTVSNRSGYETLTIGCLCFLTFLPMHQQDGPFVSSIGSTCEPSDQKLEVCGNPPERELSSEKRDHRVLPERTDAERDDPQTKTQPSPLRSCFPSCDVTGEAEGLNKNSAADKDGRTLESTGDSTTVWSSLEMDINFGPPAKG